MEEALRLIKNLYKTKDGKLGGYGQNVFDDGNIEDDDIRNCINDAIENKFSKTISEETRQASLQALKYFQTLQYKDRYATHNRFWND